MDETILPVNDRPKSTRKGYVWAVRLQDVILKLLQDYKRSLQTDSYAAYSIYEDKKGVLPLGKAISYAFGMWPRVSRYCKEGRFRIDNNDIERAICPWSVGRKN